MKAEKVIGIAACAFACVTGSAFANTTTNWFGAVGSDATIVLTEATTNGVDVSVSGGVITLDGEAELTFTPTETSPARSDNLVTISSSAVLTPNAVGDLPTSSELVGAQVGFAVAYDGNNVTNYHYYASGVWTAGAGTPPANPTDGVTFTITLDYRTNKAKFEVGSTVVANDVPFVGTRLNTVAACGSGSLTEVSAKYEIAVVDVDGTKYGSVADAKAAGGTDSSIKQVSEAGTVDERVTADNGLSVAVCTALGLDIDDDDANIAVAPVGTDDDEDEITLAVNLPEGAEAGAVKFAVTPVGGGETTYSVNAGAIKIPLAAGTYTITPVLR